MDDNTTNNRKKRALIKFDQSSFVENQLKARPNKGTAL
jgi:hypothetical protein